MAWEGDELTWWSKALGYSPALKIAVGDSGQLLWSSAPSVERGDNEELLSCVQLSTLVALLNTQPGSYRRATIGDGQTPFGAPCGVPVTVERASLVRLRSEG